MKCQLPAFQNRDSKGLTMLIIFFFNIAKYCILPDLSFKTA